MYLTLFAEPPNTNAIYKHKVTVTALRLRGLFELARERVILNTFYSNKQSNITMEDTMLLTFNL